MAQTNTSTKQQSSGASGTKVEMTLEVHVIPVSDVDLSKQFYERLGWRFDADLVPANAIRIVQFTPPGSGVLGHRLARESPAPRLVRPRGHSSSPTLKRPTTNWSAAASTQVRCGMGRRFPRKRDSAARILSVRATGPSAPSMIPTAIPG